MASPTLARRADCEYGPVALSVLVVDDDATFRCIIARALVDWGHVVIGEAGSVEEALVRAAELRPDTALVDIGLPDGDGFALTRQLCAMPSSPRVVLISTDPDASSGPAASRAGAIGFLAKDVLSRETFGQLVEGR